MEPRHNQGDQKNGGTPFEYPIVGKSKAVDHLIKQIADLAKNRNDVILVGEAGVGKGAVAKNIFYRSTGGRSDKPFMSINLSVLDDRELEAVLYGYDRGVQGLPYTSSLRQGHAANPIKYLFIGSSYFLWYCTAWWSQSVLVATIAHAIMHGVQYIVMVHTHLRRKGPESGAWTSWLVAPRHVLAFLGICLLYSVLLQWLTAQPIETFAFGAIGFGSDLYPAIPEDPYREAIQGPVKELTSTLVEKGWLGNKAKQGFYKKVKGPDGKKDILVLDLKTLEYRPQQKPDIPWVKQAKGMEKLLERIKFIPWPSCGAAASSFSHGRAITGRGMFMLPRGAARPEVGLGKRESDGGQAYAKASRPDPRVGNGGAGVRIQSVTANARRKAFEVVAPARHTRSPTRNARLGRPVPIL